jgi:hypothetical protein
MNCDRATRDASQFLAGSGSLLHREPRGAGPTLEALRCYQRLLLNLRPQLLGGLTIWIL